MRLLSILLLLPLSACSTTTLPTDKNPYQLPLKNGLAGYWRTEVKKGVKLDELYWVARAWGNKVYYQLEWERPIRKTMLLHSSIIPPSRIQDDSSDYYANVRVDYYSTVIAKDDTCKIVASTFFIHSLKTYSFFLEKVADNKLLCQSVNRKMNELVNSLSAYIRKNAEKP